MAVRASNRGWGGRVRRRCCFLAIAAASTARVTDAQVPISWLAPVSDSWTAAGRWSGGVAPDGGASAVIAAGGPSYAVSLFSPISLSRVQLDSPAATFRLEAGALQVDSYELLGGHFVQLGGTLAVDELRVGRAGGGSAELRFLGGAAAAGFTLLRSNSAVRVSGGSVSLGGIAADGSAGIVIDGGTLRAAGVIPLGTVAPNITVAGAAAAELVLGPGSSLIDGLRIGITSSGRVTLEPGAFLQANHLIVGGGGVGASLRLTPDSYLLVNGGSFSVASDGAVEIVTGATLSVPQFSGPGVDGISFTGGTVRVTGPAGLSVGAGSPFRDITFDKALEVSAGTLNLAAGASLTLSGGTVAVKGFARDPGASLSFAAGTFALNDTSATVDIGVGQNLPPLRLQNQSTLINAGATRLQSAAAVSLEGGTFITARLLGVPSQFAWTSGTLRIEAHTLDAGGVLGDTLTIGQGRTLSLGEGTINAGRSIVVNGGSISVDSRLTNTGLLQLNQGVATIGSGNGSDLLSIGKFGAAGATVVVGGSLVVNSPVSIGASGPGTMSVAGGNTFINRSVVVGGPMFAGMLVQSAGTLNLAAGGGSIHIHTGSALDVSGGTLLALGRSLTNDGTIMQSGGVVRISSLKSAHYRMTGGSLSIGGDSSVIGSTPQMDVDSFVQEAGTVNVGRALVRNSVQLTGGHFAVGELELENAQLQQGGGSLTVRFNLNVGRDSLLQLDGVGARAELANLSILEGGLVEVTSGSLVAVAASMQGGQFNIAGGTNPGRVEIGPGGITLGGDSPLVLVGTDSTQNGQLLLGGPMRSVVRSGVATVAAAPVGSGQIEAMLDLRAGEREFHVDDGDSTTDLRIALPVTNGSILKRGPGQLTLASKFQGAGGLRLEDGTLLLQGLGASTFAGGIALDGGTLVFSRDAQLGDSGNSVRFNGGTLKIETASTSTFELNRRLLIEGTGTLVLPAAATTREPIEGGGTLTVLSAGLCHLGSSNSFNGVLAINSGQMRPGAAFGFLNLNTLSISSGGSFFAESPGAVASTTAIELGGGSLVLSQTVGTLRLKPGDSQVGGSILFSGGLVGRDEGAALDIAVSSTVAFPLGLSPNLGRWATSGDSDFARVEVSTGRLIPFTSTDYAPNFVPGAVVSAAVPSNVATVAIDSLKLSSVVSQNLGSTLTLTAGGLLVPPNANSSINGGTLAFGDELSIAVGQGGNLAISSRIHSTGHGAVSKNGPGQVVLGGGAGDFAANSYAGTTYVNRGTLVLGKAGGVNAIPGTLSINGGAVIFAAPNQIEDDATVLVNAGTLDLRGFSETIGELKNFGGFVTTGPGVLNVTSPNTMSLNGGTTVVNSGANLSTAALTVSGGNNVIESGATLTVGTSGVTFTSSQGNNPTLTLEPDPVAPGTLAMVANAPLMFSTSGSANVGGNLVAGDLNLGGGISTFNVASPNGVMAVTARVRNGGVTKSGLGTLRLSGANIYQRGTRVTAGTLEVLSPASLGTGSLLLEGGHLRVLSDSLNTQFSQPLVVNSSTLELSRLSSGAGGQLFLLSVQASGNQPVLHFTGNPASVITVGSLAIGNGVTINNDVALRIDAMSANAGRTLAKIGPGALQFGQGQPVVSNLAALEVRRGTVDGNLVGISSVIVAPTGGPAAYKGTLNGIATLTLNAAGGDATVELNSPSAINALQFIAGGSLGGIGRVNVTGEMRFQGFGTARVEVPLDVSRIHFSGGNGVIEFASIVRGTPNQSLEVSGAGRVTLSGGADVRGQLQVGTTSILKVDSSQGLSVASLSVQPGGRLDIAAGTVVVDYADSSPREMIEALVRSGRGNGTGPLWASPGINSSTAAATAGVALGVSENFMVGRPLLAPEADSTSLLIRLTRSGDANFDSSTNIDDFGILAANFNNAGGWTRGDFDYSGRVDIDDFGLLAAQFNRAFSPGDLTRSARFVPEPSSFAALLLSACAAGTGRRR